MRFGWSDEAGRKTRQDDDRLFVWFKTQGTKRAKSDGNGVNHTGGCGVTELVGKGIRKRMNRSFRTGCFMSWTFGEGQLVSDWFLVLRVVSGGFSFVSGLGREEFCHDLGRSGDGVLFFLMEEERKRLK